MNANPDLRQRLLDKFCESLLNDPSPAVRCEVAKQLAQLIRPDDRQVIDCLLQASDCSREIDENVRCEAIRTLGKLLEERTVIEDRLPNPSQTPMYLLHLSDLHFRNPSDADRWFDPLVNDLKYELNCHQIDILILSGDIGNYSLPKEYEAAEVFINRLKEEFEIKSSKIVIVPGNHDLNWELGDRAISRDREQRTLQEDETKRKYRFDHFINFYKNIKRQDYPLDYEHQGLLYPFSRQKLLFLGLNSAWKLDRHETVDADINPQALNNALNSIRQMELDDDCLKIAVWHHPLNSPDEDRIKHNGFLELLAQAGFRLAFHGHIHKAENNLYRYDRTSQSTGRCLDIICAGTFGAPTKELPTGYPWQYNLLKLEIDGQKITVYTRRRENEDGAWKPDARWSQGAGQSPLDYYTINL